MLLHPKRTESCGPVELALLRSTDTSAAGAQASHLHQSARVLGQGPGEGGGKQRGDEANRAWGRGRMNAAGVEKAEREADGRASYSMLCYSSTLMLGWKLLELQAAREAMA